MPRIARARKDAADNSLLIVGAMSVLVEDQPVVTQTSTNARGSTVASSSTTVFAESKGVAREGDTMNTGGAISSGSPTVFAG
jgi:uncharacterized Zn-binding protein involved in type VI secretion